MPAWLENTPLLFVLCLGGFVARTVQQLSIQSFNSFAITLRCKLAGELGSDPTMLAAEIAVLRIKCKAAGDSVRIHNRHAPGRIWNRDTAVCSDNHRQTAGHSLH